MFQTETVTIEHPDNPGAPMIINKSDFDPSIHKPYEPPAPALEGDQKPPEGPKSEGKAKK
jgi:hypothetical protein